MNIFSQSIIKVKGYLLSFDYYRLVWIVIIALLLFFFYTSRQCQFISSNISYIKNSFNKTRNSSNQTDIRSQLTRIIVVSHYNEDINWLDLFIGDKIPHIVYTRSSDPLIRHGLLVNKGREAVVYLRYIVDFYSNLPSSIAFIHGHRTSWHQKDPDDVVVALRALKWNKYSYMPLTSTTTTSRFQQRASEMQAAVNYELWRDVLQKELGPPPLNGIRTHCCASFVVRKEAILKHPKEFYLKIMNYINASPRSDQLTGRTLEYTWHMIFGQPAIFHMKTCDIFFCDANGRISVELAEKNA
ncbi:unnamed protein product [Adineta steineri]|uniref:Uncharacterized protein n=1 Tax=Adineta steineri TaxID=433720 RepID=A0A819DAF6_9BILA|nr:unnamed protein product [Adineta steineri]CAF4122567.1 unnamed protein product [Adineta steineri]